MEFNHYSVLLGECIEALNISPDGIYVDGTAGGAGHSREIAKRLTTGRLIAIDKDPDAIAVATERLAPYPCAQVVQGDFADMDSILARLGIPQVNGILLDLGVSSHQLDRGERGFSYNVDAPLDMRMSQSGLSARDIVNTYSVDELTRILREYGEERFAYKIARNIEKHRAQAPIETTFELVEIIKESIPAPARREGGHPAKRTFQAIRIELNRELEVLDESIDTMVDLLNPGGRLSIITFHSLEDRIVKTRFKTCENPCICPPDFPVCVCGRKSRGKVITRKPIVPGGQELEENTRSKSSKLRVFERA